MTDSHGDLVFQPTATRWVGTGRVVYDNKANPVKAYEPFFDSSPGYDDETDLVDWGVTAITGYDPLSRVIRVDNPDGTFRTIDFGAWATSVSDENDTVLASDWYVARQGAAPGSADADAAAKAAADAATPALSDLDTLGRVFRTVADNGPGGQYVTVLGLDIQGNTRTVTDPLGREVLTRDYNLAGAEIHHVSADAGEHWLATDAAGQPLAAWDGRPVQARYGYDMLRRPVTAHVTQGGGAERLAEQVTYGEGLADAQVRNLRGAIYQRQDEAGVATNAQRDFDGNVLSASRQFLTDYFGDVDWAQTPPMNAETFATAWTYDALSRPVTITTPDGSVTSPAYNERSLLAQVTVGPGGGGATTSPVTSVSYDAKGQRQVIGYGNGAVTSYAYDPDTFRLVRLQTTRPGSGGPLQDLSYTYDPVGNVTRVTDAAQQTIFFANQAAAPSADYTFDAIYRLTRAAGREHIGQADQPQTTSDDSARIRVPLPTDGQAMRNYTESYAYDPVGNITSVAHTATNGNWTRTYAYLPGGNQLTLHNRRGQRQQLHLRPQRQHDQHAPAVGDEVGLEEPAAGHRPPGAGRRRRPDDLLPVRLGWKAGPQDHRQPGRGRCRGAHLPGRLRGLPRVFARRHGHPGTAEPARPGRGRARLPHRDDHHRQQHGASDPAHDGQPLPVRQPAEVRATRTRRGGRHHHLRGVLPVRQHVLPDGPVGRRSELRNATATPPGNETRKPGSTTTVRGTTRRGSGAGRRPTRPASPMGRICTPTAGTTRSPCTTRRARRALPVTTTAHRSTTRRFPPIPAGVRHRACASCMTFHPSPHSTRQRATPRFRSSFPGTTAPESSGPTPRWC